MVLRHQNIKRKYRFFISGFQINKYQTKVNCVDKYHDRFFQFFDLDYSQTNNQRKQGPNLLNSIQYFVSIQDSNQPDLSQF